MITTAEEALNFIKNNPVFRLVSLNVKTAGVFSFKHDLSIQQEILEHLATNHPELECYFHPLNHYFLEFSHKENFQNLMTKYYPNFVGQTLKEIIENRKDNFTQEKYEVFYGRVFNYPEECIIEFSNGFANNSTKHLLSIEAFDGNVVIKCSEKTKPNVMTLLLKWEKALS